MKKVLEDELMSLAHRILKLRNRAEIHELKEEAAVLYEKLSVLSFAEKHFDGSKPTIKKYDVEKSIEREFSKEQNETNYPDGTEYNEDQIYEHNTEKIKDIVSQMPYESKQVDEMFDDDKDSDESKTENKPNPTTEDDFKNFGVHFDDLPDFEPAPSDNVTSSVEDKSKDETDQSPEKENDDENDDQKPKPSPQKDDKPDEKSKPQRTMDLFSQGKKSLNDSINKNLKIGLNDRLSFVNKLFKGDTKAYENFINHINELQNLQEAKSFLNEQINERYSHWKDKEEVANRLLNLIEKKFE